MGRKPPYFLVLSSYFLLLIEVHLGEVLVDGLGEEIAHIVSLAYLLADVCRGDVHHGDIDYCDVGMVGVGAIVVAGTRIDVYLVVLDDILPVAPTVEGGKVVGAHDEAELFVAILLAEVGEGEYGIGRYGKVKLDIAGAHVVVVVHGKAHHFETLLVGKKGAALLKRVLRRNDIPHLVEVAVCQHGVADDEVPDVDGIERAEKETDVSHRSKK